MVDETRALLDEMDRSECRTARRLVRFQRTTKTRSHTLARAYRNAGDMEAREANIHRSPRRLDEVMHAPQRVPDPPSETTRHSTGRTDTRRPTRRKVCRKVRREKLRNHTPRIHHRERYRHGRNLYLPMRSARASVASERRATPSSGTPPAPLHQVR